MTRVDRGRELGYTKPMQRRIVNACSVLWGALGLVHCGGESQPTPEPAAQVSNVSTAPAPVPVRAPPTVEFVEPKTWVSRKAGVEPVPPPDLDNEVWRVLVTQNKPLQTKTPLWQSVPAREAVELAMPEGVGYRCVIQPLQIGVMADDFNRKLKGWALARTMLCSSDGWASWNEYQYGGKILADGTREFPDESGALLRERNLPGSQDVRHTFVMMRSDKEQRLARTGPPQVMPGVQIDED